MVEIQGIVMSGEDINGKNSNISLEILVIRSAIAQAKRSGRERDVVALEGLKGSMAREHSFSPSLAEAAVDARQARADREEPVGRGL